MTYKYKGSTALFLLKGGHPKHQGFEMMDCLIVAPWELWHDAVPGSPTVTCTVPVPVFLKVVDVSTVFGCLVTSSRPLPGGRFEITECI
jgi:hypothetical protein